MSFFKSLKESIQVSGSRMTGGHSRTNSNTNTTSSNSNTVNSSSSNITQPITSSNNNLFSSNSTGVYNKNNNNNSNINSSNNEDTTKIVKKSKILYDKEREDETNEYIITIWGNISKTNKTYPIIEFSQLYPKERIVYLSAGAIHYCVLSDTGLLYTWGDGLLGRLGHGNEDSCTTPTLVSSLLNTPIIDVSAGGKHTIALSKDGVVYAWGANDSCQLGLGNGTSFYSTPQRVSIVNSLTNTHEKITTVSCGTNRSSAVSEAGSLYTWGRGDHGRLGHGDTLMQSIPKRVQSLHGHHIVDISCGGGHSVALTAKGQIFSWGRGESGQLGHGNYQQQQLTPKMIFGLQDKIIKMISCGGYHSLATDSTGQLYSWGRNDYGILGIGLSNEDGNRNSPVPIVSPDFYTISAGFQHSVALTRNEGDVYSWGCTAGGRLGSLNSTENILSPKQIKTKLFNSVLISAGEVTTIVIGKKLNIQEQQVVPEQNINITPTTETTKSPLVENKLKVDNNDNNNNKTNQDNNQNTDGLRPISTSSSPTLSPQFERSSRGRDQGNLDVKRSSSPTPSFVSLASEINSSGKDLLHNTQTNFIEWIEKISKCKQIINLIMVKQQPSNTTITSTTTIMQPKPTTSLMNFELDNTIEKLETELEKTMKQITHITNQQGDIQQQSQLQQQLNVLVEKRNDTMKSLLEELNNWIPLWVNIQTEKTTSLSLLNKLLKSLEKENQQQKQLKQQQQQNISTTTATTTSIPSSPIINYNQKFEIQNKSALLNEKLSHGLELFCSNIINSIEIGNFERIRLSMEEIQMGILETLKIGTTYQMILENQSRQCHELVHRAQEKKQDLLVHFERIQASQVILEKREKIKSEYRNTKRTSIDTSKKIEVLELEDDDESSEIASLEQLKQELQNLKKQEQALLKQQQDINIELDSLIETFTPELLFKLKLQDKISNKIKDTGLIIQDRKFSHYDIIKTFSTHPHNVYLAMINDQMVVLKEFGIGDQYGKQMFERQVTLMKMMSHKCIMPVQAIFYDRNAFLQMEYVKGGDLIDWLKDQPLNQQQPPAPRQLQQQSQQIIVNRKSWEIQKMFQQIIQAIAYMHSNGIIHRDLKLENVLVKPEDDTPVISDFDLSKEISLLSSNNPTMFVGGTELYRAPELIGGGGSSGGSYASDIWAFGIMLYKVSFPKARDPFLMPNQQSIDIPQHNDQRLCNLLSLILQKSPNARPTAHQIAVHPYFVDSQVKDLLLSRQLVDSREKLATIRAHVSSLVTMSEESNEPILMQVSRANLVQDVLLFFKKMEPMKLFSQLEVEFQGEKGLDHGGLSSEMYTLFFNDSLILNQLIKQQQNQHQQQQETETTQNTQIEQNQMTSIFSSRYGIFARCSSESPFYLFSKESREWEQHPLSNQMKTEKELYFTLGKVFLKAVIDSRPIPDVFPPMFFKYLLGVEQFDLGDLEAYDPQIASSFKKVLLLDNIDQYLSTTFEGLVDGGENIPVTDANKEEFIEKNIQALLFGETVRYRLESFKKGFLSLESLNVHFQLFSPSELQVLMCGSTMIDSKVLKNNLKFIGFPMESTTPTHFLALLDEMSQHELHLFLRFLTGMVTIPINGLEKPLSIIQVPKSDKLPCAHTCSYQLDLPDYNQFELVKGKISAMLQWVDGGFGYI